MSTTSSSTRFVDLGRALLRHAERPAPPLPARHAVLIPFILRASLNMSTREVAAFLSERGHTISHSTINRIVRAHRADFDANRKAWEQLIELLPVLEVAAAWSGRSVGEYLGDENGIKQAGKDLESEAAAKNEELNALAEDDPARHDLTVQYGEFGGYWATLDMFLQSHKAARERVFAAWASLHE